MQKTLIISQNFRSEIVYLPRLAQNFSFLQGGQRMYVRKWLALTLAGAVLAMGFSGCDRTIIEHQFHTNTITETIIEKVPVETEDVAGVQSIIDLFAHIRYTGFALYLFAQTKIKAKRQAVQPL